MKLIMITPRVVTSYPVLAFIPGWIRALARQVDHLWVVSPRVEPVALPKNVTIIQVGRDYSRGETVFHALLNFHQTLAKLTREEQIDGIFAHMFPQFAILAAPYAKRQRIPLVLWFAHRHVSLQLRIASIFADRILTTTSETCRLETEKVQPVGQGIDTDKFANRAAKLPPANRLISVGRISPVKNIETMIEAIDILQSQHGCQNIHLTLVGEPANDSQIEYLNNLKKMVSKRKLDNHVQFYGRLDHRDIPEKLQSSAIFVSACNSGLDKAILEAMAAERPVIVSNPAMQPILGDLAQYLMYEPGDAVGLAIRLLGIAKQTDAERQALGSAMRHIVLSSHNIHALMLKVVATFLDLQRHR